MSRRDNFDRLALALLRSSAEVCQIAALQNVRTEIVLKDGRNVAFWFSFAVQFATIRQQRDGKRSSAVAHQTRTSAIALFPKPRANGETLEFREDESSG